MPRNMDPAKQPEVFYQLMDAVYASPEKEVYINCKGQKPNTVRGQLQSFLRCLEKAEHPRAAEAAGLMVRFALTDDRGPGVVMCVRDRSPAAKAVLAALGVKDTGAAQAESDFMKRIGV